MASKSIILQAHSRSPEFIFHTAPLGDTQDLLRAEGGRPGAARESREHGGDSLASRGQVQKKKVVAVVEDEVDLLAVYETYLRTHGHDSVFTFTNGEEFITTVSEGRISPDLALIDYRLPGKSGIEIAKGVLEIKPEIKVIITTADDSVKDEANSLGFHFLLKPFSLAALAQFMDNL